METTISKRNYTLDILRIIAAYSVVILHTSATYMAGIAIDTSIYRQALFINSVSRYGVPFFVMISGIVFLNRSYEMSYKRVWIHNILRLLLIYLIWSGLYVAVDMLKTHTVMSIPEMFRKIMESKYHLWFLPMIMGIYVILPLLKAWVDKANKKEIELFLVAFIVLDLFINTIDLINNGWSYTISVFAQKVSFPLGEYVGYFVLGYYLWNYGIKRKLRISLYIMTPICAVVNFLLANKQSLETDTVTIATSDCDSLLAFVEITTLFILLCDLFKKFAISERTGKLVTGISKSTLGEYLVHLMILERFLPCVKNYSVLPVWMMIVLAAFVIFIISLLIAAVLRRIPIIGRYIC